MVNHINCGQNALLRQERCFHSSFSGSQHANETHEHLHNSISNQVDSSNNSESEKTESYSNGQGLDEAYIQDNDVEGAKIIQSSSPLSSATLLFGSPVSTQGSKSEREVMISQSKKIIDEITAKVLDIIYTNISKLVHKFPTADQISQMSEDLLNTSLYTTEPHSISIESTNYESVNTDLVGEEGNSEG
ncbi:hypothetical protein [Candidatus Tisiphia endosymbiont of Nemotelus uliginosus]|uniref:hypothetical protein n=1 Tax=Candidatus Tisiphia endosymbiont of Nemotelus uliginosus TaxID=3077926 RepID=UPI0035C8F60F